MLFIYCFITKKLDSGRIKHDSYTRSDSGRLEKRERKEKERKKRKKREESSIS